MKRVVKKTIATVLSSAMMFGTMLSGGVAPVFAEVFAPDTEDLAFDVLADTQYDDGSVDDSGFFFMQGGKFGEDTDENAVLVVIDENGKKTEIPSSTSEGRKFTKAVTATSGSFYNMVELFNGNQCALVRPDGSYFGGTDKFFEADYIQPVSNDLVLIGTDTGKTVSVSKKDYTKVYHIYDYKLVTSTGKEISIGEQQEKEFYFNYYSDSVMVGDIAVLSSLRVIYNTKTDMLKKVSEDENVKLRTTGGNYYAVTENDSTTVYDGTGQQVMTVPYTSIDTSVLDTEGYAVVSKDSETVLSWRSKLENIVSKDGTLWNNTDWNEKGADGVSMSVVNSEKKIYSLSARYANQTGTSSAGRPQYTYVSENYLYSADGKLSMDLESEIQKLGTQSSYSNISGQYYSFGDNLVISVYDLDNRNTGAIFAYTEADNYQNGKKLQGNDSTVNNTEKYMLTVDRTYTSDTEYDVNYKLAGLYNEQLESISLQSEAVDTVYKDCVRFRYANDRYVFYLKDSDGAYSMLDKNGSLEGKYTYDVDQLEVGTPADSRRSEEAYVYGASGNKNDGYRISVYNAQGTKIVSDYTSSQIKLDGDKNYLLVYEQEFAGSEYTKYLLCDHNGNVLMTNEQYGLYDFFAADDGALLACVYNTDADGNKKFGAVKIASADIDLDKNGAYIENGEIRYYVNGKVSSDYTGMSVDAEGHKYWFDNGTAAKDKQVYSPADDAWYWFDANGTMAVGKDVFIPKSNDDRSQGKWVRYDENGHMVKGEDYANGGWYRFDEITGEMAKGFYSVEDGEDTKLYYYNKDTGIMEHGAVNIDGTEYAFDDVTGVAVDKAWYSVENAPYWYENGVRQGMEGRGKEIYDPISDGWYWLDAVDGGKKAVSKDVYQESYAGAYADREDGTGKWVRYNAEGRMIKGWSEQNGNRYYFDLETGAMAKGTTTIDGTVYTFSWVTGALQ